jgi:hypothetical protein
VAARIPVGAYVEELVAGEGGVWANAIEWPGGDPTFSLVRVDSETNEIVAEIPDVSGPLAVGADAVWAVDRAGARAGTEGSNLLRIDPATNEVVERILLGVAAWDIEFGEGYVWVLALEPQPGEGDIVQIDPATNEVVARIEIPVPETGYPPTVFAPAVGEGLAWVPVCCPDNDLQLVRIDVRTGRIAGDPITVPGGAPFAVAAGHVWIVKEAGALYGLNMTSLEVDESISGFDWPAGGFPDPTTELDAERLSVWVAHHEAGSVTRVDLSAPPVATESTGSITADDDDLLPEGRLLVQVEDQAELIGQGSSTSSLVGTEMIALDLSPDGSRALVSMPFETEGADTPLLSIDLDTGERTLIVSLEGWTLPAKWSPDGSTVAYRVGERNTLCIRDLEMPEPRCLPEIGAVYAFDWSPDGTQIVMDQPPAGLLTVLDVRSNDTRVVARWDDPAVLDAIGAAGLGEPVAIQFQGPLWSPTGEHVAVLAMVRTDEGPAGNVVLVFDLNGEVVARGTPFHEFSVARDWSPTGDAFAYAAGEPPYRIDEARLLEPATGRERVFISTAEDPPQMIQGLLWSPSGRWLAVSVYPSEIRIIDVTGAEPPRVFRSPLDDALELVSWE